MRNYIIFYVILIAFIAGGIYLTTYSLEKQKKEKFEGTNHHQKAGELLQATGQVKSADIQGKSLVFFSWTEYGSKPEDFKNLNDLVVVSPENVEVMAISNADQEYGESYFIRKKIKPEFRVLHRQEVLKQYLDGVVTNFYDSDSLKFMKMKTPVTVVIDPAGKVKFAKIGRYPALMKDVKDALSK